MAELRVPELVENPFREHYRELIRVSVERSAAAQGKRLPAADGEPARARFGPAFRSSIRLLWLVALVLLVVDLAVLGIDSWTTTIADVGLIVLTLAWFWVCVEDLVLSREPAADQLELVEER